MRLGSARLLKILFSSLFIQTSWSFFSMQGMGFLYNLINGTDKEKREKIMKAHKGFFNTHPYMVSYIIGATIRAYDEGNSSPDELKKFISVAQTTFASAGDLLFWQTIRPALLLISVILGIKFGIVGPIFFIIFYNILHLYHRGQGIADGYRMGKDVIYLLRSRRFTTVQHIFETFGAIFSGLLLCLISLNTSYLLIIPLALLFIMLFIKQCSQVWVVIIGLILTTIIAII